NNDILLKVIKRDDLNAKEIYIWKHLVEWGVAQLVDSHKRIYVKLDTTQWKDCDFMTFKKYLDPFIPYIRFHEMSIEDLHHNIRPYEKALPKNLYRDLETYFTFDRKPKCAELNSRISIDSVIIERKQSEIISSWIEKKSKKLSCQFKLSYRGTRDKFNFNSVIDIYDCDVATLLLIKVKKSDLIIGGYNPSGWKTIYDDDPYEEQEDYEEQQEYYEYLRENNEYLWTSTEDRRHSNTHILSRVEIPENAIYNYNQNNDTYDEPYMNFGGRDLVLNGRHVSCSQYSYEKMFDGDAYFDAEEIEIFK
ncbi:22494_t:CDS:2, partial [Racocetra persica]